MRSAVWFLAASFALAGGVHAQGRPDFSGTWRLDVARSDTIAQTDGSRPITVTITHTSTELRVESASAQGTTATTYRFAQSAPLSSDNAQARWSADAVITDALVNVRGQSVTVQQTRRLNPDGNEMTVESVVNVQHGYTLSGAQTYSTLKEVFVKVKP
jgi:phage baseplate assembly protein gpV